MVSDPRLTNYRFANSLEAHASLTALAGPFHRLRSDTQTEEDDRLQIESGLLLGDVPRGGMCPTVQAYFGTLPLTESGIEFLTATLPHQIGLPPGFGANWYRTDTAFTGQVVLNGRELAAITIVVTRWQR